MQDAKSHKNKILQRHWRKRTCDAFMMGAFRKIKGLAYPLQLYHFYIYHHLQKILALKILFGFHTLCWQKISFVTQYCIQYKFWCLIKYVMWKLGGCILSCLGDAVVFVYDALNYFKGIRIKRTFTSHLLKYMKQNLWMLIFWQVLRRNVCPGITSMAANDK